MVFDMTLFDDNVADVIAHLTRGEHYNRRDAFALASAYALATSSDYTQTRLGAVIMYKGNIVGSGCNSNRSDPTQKRYNRRFRTFHNIDESYPCNMDGIHAEMRAIKSVPYNVAHEMNWRRATMYVYRISLGHKRGIGLARPCPACMSAIRDSGIQEVVYTTNDGIARETIA